ncbi:MAG: hypothetical protein U1F77_11860 [Kiritimatiellia bacterium]
MANGNSITNLTINGGTVGGADIQTHYYHNAGTIPINMNGGILKLGERPPSGRPINSRSAPIIVSAAATTTAQILGVTANATLAIRDGTTQTFNVGDGTQAVDLLVDVIISQNNGVSGILKDGSGTLRLTRASAYTGATTVAGGAWIGPVRQPAGVIAAASAPAFAGGILNLGNNAGASAQTLGNPTLAANSGRSTVSVVPNGGTGTTLALGATRTPNPGATVLFDLSAGTPATAVVASNPALSNGVIGGYATVRDNTGTGFATVSAGSVVRYTGGSVLAAGSSKRHHQLHQHALRSGLFRGHPDPDGRGARRQHAGHRHGRGRRAWI